MAHQTGRAKRTPLLRCPACGERLDSASPTRCPLCEFEFGDDRVTNTDVTPYAAAYAYGASGWRQMVEWVWFAGSGRINHLALMRTSAASRRFARINLLLLSVAAALFQTAHVGWRWEAADRTIAAPRAGPGWLHVADTAGLQPRGELSQRVTDLWWNPVQAVVVLGTASMVALIVLLFLAFGLRAGVTLAHASQYRSEQRMTAAIQYSTAWAVPVALGAIVIAVRPVAYVGGLRQWAMCPPQRVFDLTAAVFAGFGLIMWWFWLVRLGATAPIKTRSRVAVFFALAAPVLFAAAATGWWMGLDVLYPRLFELLDLSF